MRGIALRAAVALVGIGGLSMTFPALAAATPATLYVAGIDGVNAGAAADAGGCQAESVPCASLAYAVGQASPGDTIEISGTLDDGAAVSLSQDLTLAANPDGSSATIEGNGDSDGLIAISGSQTVIIRGLTLLDGENNGTGGGAITNETGDLTIIDSTLKQNTAVHNGGAIDNGEGAGGGSVTVIDSSLYDNSAINNGGAIANADGGAAGSVTVTDSTFSENLAYNNGGAIDNNDDGGFQGSVTIADSTLAYDSADNRGSEIDTNDNSGFDSSVYVAGDVLDGTCDSTTTGGAIWVDSGFNAASDSSCLGGSAVASDATVGSAADELATLENYGGPTQTMVLEQGSSGLALMPHGTSITTGQASSVTVACPATDQRGVNSAPGQACDAGATQQTAQTTFASGTGGDNAGAASDSNDCSDASTPCATLQGALAQTAPTGTVELSGTFAQSEAANIGASVTVEPNPAATGEPTIDGTAQDTNGLIDTTGTGADITLTGLLLENGNSPTGDSGGAINHNAGGQLTVNASTLLDNVGQNGGAIDNNDASGGASLIVTDSTLTGNYAPDGGAIDNNDNGAGGGTVTIAESTLTDNAAADGGAIDNNDNNGTGGSLTVTDSTLTGDSAFQLGPEIGNSHYDTGGSVYVAADVFGGSCTNDSSAAGSWTDSGYNAATDSSCLGSSPAGSDAIAATAGDLGALANNGGATQTLELFLDNPAVGLIPNSTSLTTGPGSATSVSCPITADQRGFPSLSAGACDAGAVQYTGQVLSFGSAIPATVVVGQPGVTVSASSTSGLAPSLNVDGTLTTNAACTLGGTAVTFAHAGVCVIDADQSGDENFSPPATIAQAITVAPAGTRTALAYAGGDLSATVSAIAPGGGTPSGTVQFGAGSQIIGTASLSNGAAELAYTAPTNNTAELTASYVGTADYTASSSSALTVAGPVVTTPAPTTTPTTTTTPPSRAPAPKPRISAKLSSSRARSRTGWWTSTVKVTFSCAAHGARLSGPCPRPVLLTHSGRGQHLTRTIRTTAGKAASVSVVGINIDLLRPSVRIAGPNAHRAYVLRSPTARCQASEPISGIRSCKLSRRTTAVRGGHVVHYIASATSNTGMTTKARSTVHVSDIALLGATPKGDRSYAVTPGRSYTLEVLAKMRPAYLNAAPSPLGPTGPNSYFTEAGSIAGSPLWRVTIRITPGFARFPAWTIGVRTGGATTLLRLLT